MVCTLTFRVVGEADENAREFKMESILLRANAWGGIYRMKPRDSDHDESTGGATSEKENGADYHGGPAEMHSEQTATD